MKDDILTSYIASKMSSSSSSKNIVLTVDEWNVPGIRYTYPKISEKGSKSIKMLSTQTNVQLKISTPLMMTWGISDYTDDKGVSNEKYSISLNFPSEDYADEQTTLFLNKLKEFETKILADAVVNSNIWWPNENITAALSKHMFFPFLKYPKNKNTKTIDTDKPPSFRAKVPFYNEKWDVEIYNTKEELIFPDPENPSMVPSDFVPKQSNVACVIECGGIWMGGKGWGITWKLLQCIVIPKKIQSISGKCHIKLSNNNRYQQEEDKQDEPEENYTYVQPPPPVPSNKLLKSSVPFSTEVPDSDDDNDEKNTTQKEQEKQKKIIESSLVLESPPVTTATTPLSIETTNLHINESEVVVPPPNPKKKVVKKKVV